MDKYIVTGMTCAACQAHVEKAVNSVEGVESCNVSLLTNSMSITGTADSHAIIKAVEDAGYGAKSMNEASDANSKTNSISQKEEALIDRETPLLKKKTYRISDTSFDTDVFQHGRINVGVACAKVYS